MNNSKPTGMKALYVEIYGKPLEVLHLENVAIPILARVRFVCESTLAHSTPRIGPCARASCPFHPRGIGFDVSGAVDALGEGVANVNLGARVFGVPDYIGCRTAGAAEYAILKVFLPVPPGIGPD